MKKSQVNVHVYTAFKSINLIYAYYVCIFLWLCVMLLFQKQISTIHANEHRHLKKETPFK